MRPSDLSCMPSSHTALIAILQAAVAPVILISGVGLLLLSMTNRYGRVIDRARHLAREQASGSEDSGVRSLAGQASVIWRRAKLLRAAIVLATLSIFLVSLTVAGIFVQQLMGISLTLMLAGLFICSIAALAGSLILFLRDITLSLHALRLELASVGHSTDA